MKYPKIPKILTIDNYKVPGGKEKRVIWGAWSRTTSAAILELLETEKRGVWSAEVQHVECVKSYGPRVYHLVLDLVCKPVSRE